MAAKTEKTGNFLLSNTINQINHVFCILWVRFVLIHNFGGDGCIDEHDGFLFRKNSFR